MIVIQRDKLKHRKAAENIRFAKNVIGATLSLTLIEQLRELTKNFALSLRLGDLLFLNGGWYVTYTGLIRLATRRRCRGIQVKAKGSKYCSSQSDCYSDLSCIAFRASATVIIRVIGSTGEAMKPHFS